MPATVADSMDGDGAPTLSYAELGDDETPTLVAAGAVDDDAPTMCPEFLGDDEPTMCPEFLGDERPMGELAEEDEAPTDVTRRGESLLPRRANAVPLVGGETLRMRLRGMPRGVGFYDALTLVRQVLSCHASDRIPSRLFAPETVLVTRDERMVLTGEHVPDAYWPPELRAHGSRFGERAQVFSLGVLFHELMTGLRPYREQSDVSLSDRWSLGMSPIKLHTRFRDRFNGVNRLFRRALAEDPEKRFQTLDDFRRALDRFRDFGY